MIDRSEFEQTFLRNMADLTNKEPRELYNIIQVRLLLSVRWMGKAIDWNRQAERWREGA